MMARKPGWDSQQLSKFGETIWRESCKEENDNYTRNTRFIGGKVDDISKVDEKTQSMYRSGVETLFYLTNHSRHDITNPVRELSKHMDGASMAHVTEMYRVIS